MPEDNNYDSFTLQQFTDRDFSTITIPKNKELENQGIYFRASRTIPNFTGSKEAFVCNSWGYQGTGGERINPAVVFWDNAAVANKTIMQSSLIPISDLACDQWFINLKL